MAGASSAATAHVKLEVRGQGLDVVNSSQCPLRGVELFACWRDLLFGSGSEGAEWL